MMKKIISALALLVIGVLACQSGTPPTVQNGNVETIVASTLQTYTQQAPKGIPVTFQNVSFVISEGLASGADSKVIPPATEDQGGPWGVAPQFIQFTLNGYVSLGTFNEIQISVYPAKEYAAANQGAATAIAHLQAILASPSAPITLENYPHVTSFNAGAMIIAQPKLLTFNGGTGVRAITQFGQAVGPITNTGVFYLFHGLTSDGKYYIIATLPTGAPFLAYDDKATPPQPADAIPFTYSVSVDPKDYENYFKAVTDKLNSTDVNTFQPSLNTLDQLIQSITVQ